MIFEIRKRRLIKKVLKVRSEDIFENEEYIKEYLKDEECCIVYFINKEETFKANGWELK